MLRYRFATPLLWTARAMRALGPGKAGFRILLFHEVPDSAFPEFGRLIAHVKKVHGVLSPDEAGAWIDGGGPPPTVDGGRHPCLFSFDDGFQSNFELATTVLADHAVKALFFVSPGLVEMTGNEQRAAIASGVFDGRIGTEQLDPELRLMPWDQIRELKSQGHTVGCHGMSHRRLSKLDGGDLRNEIVVAGDLLDTRLGEPAFWYAYAFGDIDSVSAEALNIIGERYRFCRSGVRGLNITETPSTAVLADHIPLAAPPGYQKLILEGSFDSRYAEARRRLRRLAEI